MATPRRASEDARFRAFLSSHFDAQAFVTNVIREGRSEECFAEITSNIIEVDEEIKSYISVHKHDLMNGMHDVADLSKRYQGLEATSKKLRGAVDKMQKETANSYELVKTRTLELERIHETSVLLRQLRQFVHAKAQLDHYVQVDQKAVLEQDLRQFAAMAKTVHEMESLVRIPQLAAVKIVAAEIPGLRRLGQQLRSSAQERLLVALNEQNQATVGDCLQVFFNLQSLNEVVLLAIDETVKGTAEVSSASLDLQMLLEGGSSGSGSVGDALSSAQKKKVLSGSERKGALSSSGQQPLSNPMQLRMAMREMCHQWAAAVQEQAVKIHVLQRVIVKKEDPATHQRFVDVLKMSSGEQTAGSVGALLGAGRLVDVFWMRLSTALQDVIAIKVRTSPSVTPRVYPSLRRAALDVFTAMKGLAARSAVGGGGLTGRTGPWSDQLDYSSDEEEAEDTIGEGARPSRHLTAVGLFGSMLSTSAPYCLGAVPGAHRRVITGERRGAKSGGHIHPGEQGGGEPSEDGIQSKESGLLSSLAPMRDRFLVAALSRMNAPVLQMFPEVEGYTAAVPSKRDMLTLIKAIQDEVITVVLEGDRSLLKLVGREALKSVQLLLTKVENMAGVGPESTRIVFHHGQYHRTHPQEHNSHLVVLVSQLQDAVQKIAAQVVKATRDSPGTALSGSSLLGGGEEGRAFGSRTTLSVKAGGQVSEEAVLNAELQFFVASVMKLSNDLARQLMSPLVEALMEHFRDILAGMLKEGLRGPKATAADVSTSRAVATVVTQLPQAYEVYFDSLPRCSPVIEAATELTSRLLATYTTVASLRRPVNEETRLLCASEISALDMLVTSRQQARCKSKGSVVASDEACLALQEVRAFRRLIFDVGVSVTLSEGKMPEGRLLGDAAGERLIPAPAATLLALPFVRQLRVSSLLAYLVCCGPTHLSSPADVSTSSTVADYIRAVSSPDSLSSCDSLFLRHPQPQSEKLSVEAVRQSLDLFMQRIAVEEDVNIKKLHSAWYTAILDICNAATANFSSHQQ